MKRMTAILLCLSLFLCLWGCHTNDSTPREPVRFFYLQAAQKDALTGGDGLLSSEARESTGHTGDYPYLMQLYLTGPLSDTLRSPFPAGTTLKSLRIKNGIVYLVLSDSFAALRGTELTLACACLTKTINEISGFRVVSVQAETQLLDGNRKIVMNVKDIVFTDSSTE